MPLSIRSNHGDEETKEARRQRSSHGAVALLAMLVPAISFGFGLVWLSSDERFKWLSRPAEYPWELWVVAICGSIATVAGVIDWRIHRAGRTVVGIREHRAHVAALAGGGIPLFAVMALASLSPRPVRFLVPAMILLIATVAMICYDEFMFHRRCGKVEALTHRLLTFGNGIAFLAWAQWCFVRGGTDA